MFNLPVVLVDAADITNRHLILIDGWPSFVTHVTHVDGAVHVRWAKDAARVAVARSGELTLRSSDLVPCVRWADWIAVRP